MFEFSVDYIAELLDGTVEGDGAVKNQLFGKNTGCQAWRYILSFQS